MPRQVEHFEANSPLLDDIPFAKHTIGGRAGHRHAEGRAEVGVGIHQQARLVGANEQGRTGKCLLERSVARNMIGMAMRVQDGSDRQSLAIQEIQNRFRIEPRINHDRVEWHGSSPTAIEQPDFLWSEDNWFRPVDIELGPDGALYVADFYNRIIGHYEVPLTHPGRDRHRGRIWRIVYRGTDGKKPAKSPRNGFAPLTSGQDCNRSSSA